VLFLLARDFSAPRIFLRMGDRLAFSNGILVLSVAVFLTAAITKFTEGAWVALLAVALGILVASRIRRHHNVVSKETALRAHPGDISPRELTAAAAPANGHITHRTQLPNGPDTKVGAEAEETPEQLHHLIIVALAALDLPGVRALPKIVITTVPFHVSS
jgi:hypothetical protein